MKRFVMLAILGTAAIAVCDAQELGVRFGNVSGGNVALDGVLGVGAGRIHADVSFGDGVGVDLLWDFIYGPLGGEAFHYYIGAGPYAFLGDPFQLGVIAELGLEYRFKEIPISISGDWRPYFRLVDNTDFDAGGFGFNVRWVF